MYFCLVLCISLVNFQFKFEQFLFLIYKQIVILIFILNDNVFSFDLFSKEQKNVVVVGLY